MDHDLFEFVAERIEEQTGMGRLEARGTLRIALKASGFAARGVTATQMCVVLERVIPASSTAEGWSDPKRTATRWPRR